MAIAGGWAARAGFTGELFVYGELSPPSSS